MFNKNDPLIDSVKKVMEQNAKERAATASVNERFGITDRKALPREKQGEWDAAYKSILLEDATSDARLATSRDNKYQPNFGNKFARNLGFNPTTSQVSSSGMSGAYDNKRVNGAMQGATRRAGAMAIERLKKARAAGTAPNSTAQLPNNVPTQAPAAVSSSAATTTPAAAAPAAAPAATTSTPAAKPAATKPTPRPAAAAPAPEKKLSFFQKQSLRNSERNDTADQTARLRKLYNK